MNNNLHNTSFLSKSRMSESIISIQRKLNTTQNCIDNIRKETSNIHKVLNQEISTLYHELEKKKKEIQKLQEELKLKDDIGTCILCFENKKNVLFKPCNHIVICDVCSGNTDFKECIVCRTTLTAYEYAYL